MAKQTSRTRAPRPSAPRKPLTFRAKGKKSATDDRISLDSATAPDVNSSQLAEPHPAPAPSPEVPGPVGATVMITFVKSDKPRKGKSVIYRAAGYRGSILVSSTLFGADGAPAEFTVEAPFKQGSERKEKAPRVQEDPAVVEARKLVREANKAKKAAKAAAKQAAEASSASM